MWRFFIITLSFLVIFHPAAALDLPDTNISAEELIAENDFILSQEPGNVTAWQFRALILYNEEKYAEAINASERCISLDPSNGFAWHIIGNSWGNLGDTKKAVDAFKTAVALNPEDPAEYNVQGVALSRDGNYPEAIESFKTALKIYPEYPAAWNNLGVTYYGMGDDKNGIEAVSKAISLTHEEPVFLANKGFLLLKQGNAGEALINGRQAKQLDMTCIPAWFVLGDAFFADKKWNDAYYSYDGGFSTRKESQTWYYQGGKSLHISKEMQPVDAYYRSIAENVRFTGLWDKTRVVEYKLRRYAKTIETYDQIMEISPDFGVAWKNKGYCALQLGKFESAKEAYSQALTLLPDDNDVMASYGYAVAKTGDYLTGMNAIKKSLEKNPSFARGYYLKAGIHDMYGEKTESREAYEKALSIEPGNSQTHTSYADLLRKTGDWPGFFIHFIRGSFGI